MPSPAVSVTLARVGLGVAAAAVAVLVLGPLQGSGRLMPLSGKQAHIAVFFVMTALAMVACPRVRRNDIALAALGLAIASEVAQAVVGRDGNFGDAVADAAGILMAVIPTYIERMRAEARGERTPRRRRSDVTGAEIEVTSRQET